jgi:excisionase family DNA binding protein
MSSVEPSLLSFAEAAERLRCSESWLRKRVSRREVPHVRIAGKIRFTEDDLAQIVTKHGVPAELAHPLLDRGGNA